jgi:hypothetical protein
MRSSVRLLIVAFMTFLIHENALCRDGGSCASVIDTFRMAECGNATIESCVRNHSSCAIAGRLKKFGLWLDTLHGGMLSCATIASTIKERYLTLTDTHTVSINTSIISFIGSPHAPVTIVLYISTTCPLCKRVYKDINTEITSGVLRSKARVGVKFFTTSSCDVALLAAMRYKKQRGLILALADVKERITPEIVVQKAGEIGMPVAEFRAMLKDSLLRGQVEASRAEAIKNGVELTPTAFINNKRYASYKDPQWIIDAAAFEYETNVQNKKDAH